MLQVLELKGTPYEIGIQHGKQINELVRSFFSLCYRAVQEISEDQRLNTLYNVEEGLQVYYPEATEEMKGVAEASGLSYEDVLLMNFTSEVRTRAAQGCTAFSAINQATRTGAPITGKTRDMASQVYYPFQVAMNISTLGKMRVFLAEAFSGMVVTGCGMNDRGLALNLNIIVKITDPDDTVGVQRAFLARKVLEECSNVEEAIKLFTVTNLAYQGANFMVCDAEGSSAVIEKSHSNQALMFPENGILAMANHFEDKKMKQYEEFRVKNSPVRLQRMKEMLLAELGKIDLSTSKRFLKDHKKGNELSICRHVLAGVNTVSAYLLEPRTRTIYVADGHPCWQRFRKYEPFGR